MIYKLVMRSEGMHGYVAACDLILQYDRRPNGTDILGILDTLQGRLCREVEHVKYALVSTQNLDEFDSSKQPVEVHATISICYDGQEVPSTEINFTFFRAYMYHFYKGRTDFSQLAAHLMNFNKEITP